MLQTIRAAASCNMATNLIVSFIFHNNLKILHFEPNNNADTLIKVPLRQARSLFVHILGSYFQSCSNLLKEAKTKIS